MSIFKNIKRKLRIMWARTILYVIRNFTEEEYKQTVRKGIIDIFAKDNFSGWGNLDEFLHQARIEAIATNDDDLWEEVKILDKFLTKTAK